MGLSPTTILNRQNEPAHKTDGLRPNKESQIYSNLSKTWWSLPHDHRFFHNFWMIYQILSAWFINPVLGPQVMTCAEALGSRGHGAPGRLAPGWGRNVDVWIAKGTCWTIVEPRKTYVLLSVQHGDLRKTSNNWVLTNKTMSCFGEQQSVM